MNIFEQLNILLVESKGDFKKNNSSDIPIHPEMETKEQGKMAAAEKILKLFQKLHAGSGGQESVNDGRPEIPDDLIDPKFKKQPNQSKEKKFDKNKLTDWDEESEEKVQKEIDVNDNQEDDEFDDFDYKNNPFGDEEEDDDTQEQEDERSEDEKLNDSLNDAIDCLDNEDGGEEDDSGADWGEDEGNSQDGEGNNQGQSQSQGQSGDDEKSTTDGSDRQGGESQDGQSNQGGSGKSSGETQSAKKKRLEELKNALESKNIDKLTDKIEDMKQEADGPTFNKTPGGRMETPSDESVEKDMKSAGLDDKTIENIVKEKNHDTSKDYDDKEMEELTNKVIDGLERECRDKGGSALADTIVTNSLKNKITNEEWKEILELFLNKKAKEFGRISTSDKDIKWGNKNHLWRKAVLPTYTESQGSIMTINCFVDFSGSVNKDLVYNFLSKVIDLCIKLKYTCVRIYGFSDRLGVPRTIDAKTIKNDGLRAALSQTWDFIKSQNLGSAEEFKNVAEEINKIKRKNKESVFLIFGDALWASIRNLKDNIASDRYFKDMCILAYYSGKPESEFKKTIGIIKGIIGIEHVITSKAESIFT